MSGDLMYKGIAELAPADYTTITEDDLIPVYQKRTLSVMKVRVGDLVSAIVLLTAARQDVAKEAEEAPVEEAPVEEAPVEEAPKKRGGRTKKEAK